MLGRKQQQLPERSKFSQECNLAPSEFCKNKIHQVCSLTTSILVTSMQTLKFPALGYRVSMMTAHYKLQLQYLVFKLITV